MPRKLIRRNPLSVHTVPENYKKEFDESTDRVNVSRARLTCLAFVIMEILVIAMTAAAKWDRLLDIPERWYMLMYLGMLLVMSVLYGVFAGLQKDVPANGKAIRVWGTFFTCFILCWAAGITLLDQMHSGQIMVYTVAVLAVAVTPLFAPAALLFMYLPVHAAFLILIICFRQPGAAAFGNIVNSTTFVIISWAISYMRYVRHIDAFKSGKLIGEKNAELERMNAELQKANKALEKLSRTDGLTGVSNRAMFDLTLSREWDRCRRQSASLSLIMIDIDYFKPLNDHYGHQAGDRCIRLVAESLTACARRASDTVARYGGEEFAVILPDTDARQAAALAETIRKKVDALSIPHAHSNISDHVTISLGVCCLKPAAGSSADELVGCADKAMYAAKKRHNCVATFDTALSAAIEQ